MWQTDSVTLQTKTESNVNGSIKSTWADATVIPCDVQDINKEFAFKNYGLTDSTEYKQVFDHTLSTEWVKGNQVKYDGEQWWVRVVQGTRIKIGASNHVYVILSKVI